MADDKLQELIAQVATAYLSNNKVEVADIPRVMAQIQASLTGGAAPASTGPRQEPAVDPKKSIHPDYLICLEDGKKLKMLKRYLRSAFNLTPEAYRTKWGLPMDYPMVAPKYAEVRSKLAKASGLGKPAPVKKKPRR